MKLQLEGDITTHCNTCMLINGEYSYYHKMKNWLSPWKVYL